MSSFRRAALIGLLFVLPIAVGPATVQAKVFDAKQTVLDNGLQVVVVENHRAPVVTQMVWYKVGAMDEPAGKSGLAHFLEHLMFKGTPTHPAGEFSAIVSRNGGEENAFTTQDYTAYFQSVASDRLELVMTLEADRMANLDIDATHFEPEKKVILEERSMRTDNEPGSILSEQAGSAFYRNHPYAIPVIGWRHEIEALTLEDAQAFYRRFYAPNNAILVVSGDVTAQDVFDMAKRIYGPVPARELPDRPVETEPPLLTQAVVSYADPRVTTPSLSIRKQAPGWAESNTDPNSESERYALQVLSQIVGGGPTGILYRRLVIDRGLAVSAGAWYDGGNRGPSSFGFYITPKDGTSLDEAEAALRQEIDTILNQGIAEDDVKRAIVRLQDAAATAMDSLSGPARTLGASLAIGMTVDDVEAWPDRIGAVTVDAVNDAARRVFSDPGEVETRLLPKPEAEAPKS